MSDAVDEGLLSDATSRNALYKIHVSLGKIVNNLDEQQRVHQRSNRSMSANQDPQLTEERTVVEEDTIKEEQDLTETTVVLKKEEIEPTEDELTVTEPGDDIDMEGS